MGAALWSAGYDDLDPETAVRASLSTGRWWTREAQSYIAEHGQALGDAQLQWGPERVREETVAALGPVAQLRGLEVLEIGAGAAQGSRWLRSQGVRATACDISEGMIAQAALADQRTGITVPAFVADARDLPVPDGSYDVVFTAYGALPFIPDAGRVHAEVARVLRPGGRWVYSVTHPIRWAFPDDPGPRGLTAERSYFDRRPYVERDESGELLYAEFHRTLGDHVRDLRGAGLVLEDLIEPEWPQGAEHVWGGWSRLRGERLPGTAIFVSRRPEDGAR